MASEFLTLLEEPVAPTRKFNSEFSSLLEPEEPKSLGLKQPVSIEQAAINALDPNFQLPAEPTRTVTAGMAQPEMVSFDGRTVDVSQMSPYDREIALRKSKDPYRTIVLEELKKPEVQAKAAEISKQSRGFWGELFNSLVQGTLNVAAGIGGTIEKGAELVDKPGISYIGRKAGEVAAMARASMERPEIAQGQKGGAKEFIAQSVGQALPYMASSVAATILTGNPLAAFGVAGAVEGDNAYRDAIKTGATEEQANMERLIVGTINGAIEMLQVGTLFKGTKKAVQPIIKDATKKTLKKIAKIAGKVSVEMVKVAIQEGLEESLQEIVSMTAPVIHGQPVPTLNQYFKQAGKAGLGGAVAGVILGGATGGIALSEANIETAIKTAKEQNPELAKMSDEGVGKVLTEFARITDTGQIETAEGTIGYERMSPREKYAEVADKATQVKAEAQVESADPVKIANEQPVLAAQIAEKEAPSRSDFEKLGITGTNAEQRKAFAVKLKEALAEPVAEVKQAEPIVEAKPAEVAAEAKPEAETGKIVEVDVRAEDFDKYTKAMPNATEEEIVKFMIEDGLRPPKDVLAHHSELPEVKDLLEQEKIEAPILEEAPVIEPKKLKLPEKPVKSKGLKPSPQQGEIGKRTKLLTEDEVHSLMGESLDKNEYMMYLQDEFQARSTGDQEAATRAFDKEAQIMFDRGYLYNEKANQWARVSAEFKAEVELKPTPQAQPKSKGLKAKPADLDTLGGRMPAQDISAKMPVSQEVKTVQSKSVMLKRLKDRLAGHAEVDLSYDKMSLDIDSERATDFVAQNPMEARSVVIEHQTPPEGITDTAIRFAYEDMVEAKGDFAETAKAVNSIKLTGIRKGQEIAAYKGKNKDNSLQHFADIVIENKMEAAAKKFGIGLKESSGVGKIRERIKQEADVLDKKLVGKPVEEQKKVLTEWAETTFTPKQKKMSKWKVILKEIKELSERGLLDPASRHQIISDLIAEKMGVTVTAEEVQAISEKAEKLRKLEESLIAKQKQDLPAKEYFQKLTAATIDYYKAVVSMDKFLNSLNPTHLVKVATGGIGRASMLANLAPAVLNQISNSVQGTMQALERRIASGQYKGDNAEFAIRYVMMQLEVFHKTGYDLSRDYPEDMRLGEHITHSEGPGILRAYSRGLSKIVYKYLLGYSDVGSGAIARSDSTMTQTTKIARKMGLKGEARQQKALEIFKESIQISPESTEANIVREQSIADAQRATWTNDAKFANFSKGMRDLVNATTGDLQAGHLLQPFIKTNANVLQGAIESTAFGGVRAITKLPGAWRAMNDTVAPNPKPMQDTMRLAVRSGLGMVLAYLLAALIPPEDFFTAYDVMSQKQRDQLKLKKGVYNAVKIGGKWISLDFFGVLGSGFVGMMYARKYGNGIVDTAYQYSRGVVGQALQVPGIQDYSDLYTSIRDAAKANTLVKTAKTVAGDFINFVRSRTIPGIVSTVAQATDKRYRKPDRDFLLDRTRSGIPGLRQTLPIAIDRTTGEEVKGEGFWINILFGNRVKTANESALIDEMTRLETAGFGPTISDIERGRGRAQELKEQIGEEKFNEALKFFGSEYGRRATRRMTTKGYIEDDDEGKAKKLNKIRSQELEDMLAKFHYRKPKSKGLKK